MTTTRKTFQKSQPGKASNAAAATTGKTEACTAERPPLVEMLTVDPTAQPQEYLWQLLHVLEAVAGDLSIIGGFDACHERQFAHDPGLWDGDPEEYLEAVCRGDLLGLWASMIDETIALVRTFHHERDHVYGAGSPLEALKPELEAVTNVLLDVAIAGDKTRQEWEREPFVNEMLLAADGFAQHVRDAQAGPELKKLIRDLRGHAARKVQPAREDKQPADSTDGGAEKKRQEPECRHTDGFSTVWWYGKEYHFNPTEAACVRVLWAAWEQNVQAAEKPAVHQRTMRDACGSDNPDFRLIHVFRHRGQMNRAWKHMIHPYGNGMFYLGRPTEPSTNRKRAKKPVKSRRKSRITQ